MVASKQLRNTEHKEMKEALASQRSIPLHVRRLTEEINIPSRMAQARGEVPNEWSAIRKLSSNRLLGSCPREVGNSEVEFSVGSQFLTYELPSTAENSAGR